MLVVVGLVSGLPLSFLDSALLRSVDNLKRAWLQEEKRNFVEWEWIEEDSSATYKGQKFVANSGDDLAEIPEQFRSNTGNIVSMSLRAIRLYP